MSIVQKEEGKLREKEESEDKERERGRLCYQRTWPPMEKWKKNGGFGDSSKVEEEWDMFERDTTICSKGKGRYQGTGKQNGGKGKSESPVFPSKLRQREEVGAVALRIDGGVS